MKYRDLTHLKTYEAGLIQAKAYRILNRFLTECLSRDDISLPEWALLGILEQSAEPVGMTHLAEALGVENPMATSLVNSLEQKGLVERVAHASDRRARKVGLSTEGREFVPGAEKRLRKDMREFLKGCNPIHLKGYLEILEFIAKKN